MLSNQAHVEKNFTFLKFLLYCGFFIIGILTVLIGQILPILAARLSLDDRQATYFFIAQFFGSLGGVLISGLIVRRIGFVGVILIGFCLLASGILILNSSVWIFCLSAFFINGAGIGLTIPAINMLTVELNPQKSSRALNILNFFWGAGAIVCKPFVDFFSTPTSIFAPSVILSVSIAAVGSAIVFAPRSGEQKLFSDSDKVNTEFSVSIWTTQTAWLIAIFSFVHVGFESGVYGWITTYEQRLLGQEVSAGLSAAFAFFFFLVIGRALAGVYLRFLKEDTLLLLSLSVSTIGVVLVLLARDFQLLLLGASIIGFGASTVFATNTSRFTQIFGAGATRRATPLFVAGSLGGAFTTWLIGYVSSNYNDLRYGMFVLLASCLILIALQIFLILNRRKNQI